MKTLLEKTIKINIQGKSQSIKTIFTISKEEEKNDQKYYDISELSGKNVSVTYSYTEDTVTKRKEDSFLIPEGLNEVAIKDFIVSEISSKIN